MTSFGYDVEVYRGSSVATGECLILWTTSPDLGDGPPAPHLTQLTLDEARALRDEIDARLTTAAST